MWIIRVCSSRKPMRTIKVDRSRPLLICARSVLLSMLRMGSFLLFKATLYSTGCSKVGAKFFPVHHGFVCHCSFFGYISVYESAS